MIKKQCKHISAEEALDYVAGYMAFNDVSARDLQFRTGQWLAGKALDTFAPCGPALVINEIDDPQSLDICIRVNGETLQEANTSDMAFSVAETLAFYQSANDARTRRHYCHGHTGRSRLQAKPTDLPASWRCSGSPGGTNWDVAKPGRPQCMTLSGSPVLGRIEPCTAVSLPRILCSSERC